MENNIKDFDLERQGLLNNLQENNKFLSFQDMRNGFVGFSNSLENVISSRSFDEFSNMYTQNNPFGKNSLFYEESDGFFHNSGIDIKALFEYISNGRKKEEIKEYNCNQFLTGGTLFEYNNHSLPIDVLINGINGEVDFSLFPDYHFDFNYEGQKITFQLKIPFRKYKDSTEKNKYAVLINVSRGTDLEAILDYFSLIFTDIGKNKLITVFTQTFVRAKGDAQIIDFLYECAPSFVLETIKDEDLYIDLITLTNENIDTWGTNEYVSILNLISGIKNSEWIVLKFNQNFELIRSLFVKFDENYVYDLIEILSKYTYNFWQEKDFENAIEFSLDTNDDDDNSDGFVDSRIVYWCGYLPEKKKFDIGFSVHMYEKSMMPAQTGSNSLGLVDAFSCIKVSQDGNVFFLPAIVLEYFTNKQLKEDKWVILNDFATLILPEATLARAKPFLGLRLPKINNKGFWEHTNKAGSKLQWRNQLLREKDLLNAIENAIAKGGSKGWEAEVAKEISKFDEITDFNNIVQNVTKNNRAGDIDVATRKYLIECKESISKGALEKGKTKKEFLDQFEKYLNQKNANYINVENKKVILAIKNIQEEAMLNHPILKELQKKGVVIVTDLKQLKSIK